MKVITFLFLYHFIFSFSAELYAQEAETKDQTEALPTASLEEKIGQILLIGFQGTEFDSNLRERVEKLKPGGLIFFKRNISNSKNAAKMIFEIQKYNHQKKRIPIFSAIDQEGGVVTRIKTNPPLPSALAMGRSTNPKIIHSIGVAIGKKLKTIGFNLNLAPVLDLSDPNKFSFIGNRSFGSNPFSTAAAAIQFSKGVESSGVLSTAKHFPGHGNVDTDSHTELPVNALDKDKLMAFNVFPYKKSIDDNAISAVMVAHMSFPKIDEIYPATYSKKIIDILKVDLGFKGIILTDDIQMAGANIFPSISERAVQAFLAGNDMIMVAWSFPDQMEAYNGLLEAVKSGRIPESRINESFQKIYSLKKKFNLFQEPALTLTSMDTVEGKDPTLHSDIDSIFQDILEQEQKKLETIEIADFSKHPVVVISSEESFLNEFKKAKLGKKTVLMRLRKSTTFKNLQSFENKGRNFVGFVHVSGPVTARIVNRMPKSIRNNFILVNNYFPGAVNNLEDFQAVIDIPLRNAAMGRSIASWFKNPGEKKTVALRANEPNRKRKRN